MIQDRRLTKNKRQITKLRKEDTSQLILQKLERIIKKYYEQFYANLGEMEKFLESHELPTDLRRNTTSE